MEQEQNLTNINTNTVKSDLTTELSNNKSWLNNRNILITLVLLLAFLVLGFFALKTIVKDSLPSEPLYNLKTNLVEKVLALSKFSAQDRSDYTAFLIETRLKELKTLYDDTATSSPETLAKIANLINNHTDQHLKILTDANSMSSENKITTLSKVVNLTRAAEILTDDFTEFDSIKNSLEETQNKAREQLNVTVTEFASSSDSVAVGDYISEQITMVGTELTTVAPNSRAQNLAMERINSAGESISENNQVEALNYLLKARQAIAVDDYLWDSERGPKEGEVINEEPMPEGS